MLGDSSGQVSAYQCFLRTITICQFNVSGHHLMAHAPSEIVGATTTFLSSYSFLGEVLTVFLIVPESN